MKKNILKNLSERLKPSMIIAVLGSMILMSCGVQMGGYTETDGVYYDPAKDTLPEGIITHSTENTVGEYYDYDNTAYIDNVRSRDWIENSHYWDEGSSTDWGTYSGSQTNYYSDSWNYGWSPWGYYSPWGYNPYWGSGWHFGFSWGWGSSWYYPYWNYPYYRFGYSSPYYWGGFYPYWGWNSPYYYGYGPSYPYMRSGANGRLYNSYQHPQGNSLRNNTYSGFRSNRNTIQNQGVRNTNTLQQPATSVRNPNIRTQPNSSVTPRQQTTPRYNTPNSPQPRYQQPQRTQPNVRSNDSGGFRSGSSGGGIRSGSSNTRSGGFRR